MIQKHELVAIQLLRLCSWVDYNSSIIQAIVVRGTARGSPYTGANVNT